MPRRRHSSTRATEFIEDAIRLGFDWTRTRGGHLRFQHRTTGRIVFTAATPGDTRARKNNLALFRRAAKVDP